MSNMNISEELFNELTERLDSENLIIISKEAFDEFIKSIPDESRIMLLHSMTARGISTSFCELKKDTANERDS